jgi:hypothetical protein
MLQILLAVLMLGLFLVGVVFLFLGKKRTALLLIGSAVGLVLLSRIVAQGVLMFAASV